ncbi:Uncharacterized protein OS=Mesorhizobium sp. STM 4661 GN=MESS4_830393 PE=4 SV=1 [Gemmataceae bacterium]|nr:Uncharacterized protein OS=Mesorhizobium sp. STM 4661 GN=MESS4_830393 PE=4 SV=1 [Gemmataceae bacterium]VTU00749.1 Uncharacterized protein OS=Mesorhizobium sp. STM 4661 GN=MESS4_830393 PE=4 SV=1 [Gemmataceae bacterium]
MTAQLQPLGAVTGYQHPKCYAGGDTNCSPKISREHFISKTLLRQVELNNTAKVAGLKWQEPETFRLVPLDGLASHILCERHNHALSPLDDAMGRFFEAIGECDRALRPSAPNLAMGCRGFSGVDVERWMLKCIIGLAASGNIKHCELKPECVDLLFGRIDWPEHWGLFFESTATQPIYHFGSIRIETLIDPAKSLILAAKFGIRGLPFYLCLGRPSDPKSIGIWRPSAITFRTGKREETLSLTWDGTKHGPVVILDRIGTYDGPPPNWKEWEQTG